MVDLKGKPKAAMLPNVKLLLQAVDKLKDRPLHLPGLGVMYGPSGLGKSVAATCAATEYDAGYVECNELMTKTSLLDAVCKELGITPSSRQPTRMIAEIGRELTLSDKLLLIDEADFLVDRGLLETVRALHMASHAPIMLLGEERLPEKMKRFERVHNRVLTWVPAQRATLDDARQLVDLYLTIKVDDDLLASVVEQSGHRHRRIVVNLADIEQAAERDGLERASKSWWVGQGRTLYTGDAPKRQKGEI